MLGSSRDLRKAGIVVVTAMMISGVFIVFFAQAAGAISVGASPSASKVTKGDDLDVTVSIDLDQDERIPIDEVALKIQRADNGKLLKDIRWGPTCSGGSFSLSTGYDEDVATAGQCRVFLDSTEVGYSYRAHGHGYLQGDFKGYGYAPGEGYGYFDADSVEHRTGTGDGYGYGYGYDDGTVALEWDLTIDTSSLPKTDIELVGVIDTGSSTLGTFQSHQADGVVTIQSAPSDGDDGDDDGDDGGDGVADVDVDVDLSACAPRCELGNVSAGANVSITASDDDENLVDITFTLNNQALNLAVEVEVTDEPQGMDAPPWPAQRFIRIDVFDGDTNIGDDLSDIKIQWKMADSYLESLGPGFVDALGHPQGPITLALFENGQWLPQPTQRISGPDEPTFNYYETLVTHLSTLAKSAADEEAPSFSDARPTGMTGERRPTIGVDYSDNVAVDPTSVTMTFDGTDVTADADVTATGVTYTPTSDLAFNDHTVEVTVADEAGNENSRAWDFTVTESVPPVIESTAPEDGATVDPGAEIVAEYRDDGTGIAVDGVTLLVDGEDVTDQATVSQNRLSYSPADGFEPGDHTVELTVEDLAGNEQSETWSFTVEAAPGVPWGLIVGIGAIVAVGAVAAWYVLVYRKP